jgi:hypothetical protein
MNSDGSQGNQTEMNINGLVILNQAAGGPRRDGRIETIDERSAELIGIDCLKQDG